MINEFLPRPATPQDEIGLSSLLNFEQYIHRHLDWRSALDWLGYQPYWVLEKNKHIHGVLAMPPDPPEIAWIRIFAISSDLDLDEAWEVLFQHAKSSFDPSHNVTIAAVVLHSWFENLLKRHGFKHFQDIIVLERQDFGEHKYIEPPEVHEISVRKMTPDDLPSVQEVDNDSFTRLWQHSMDGLQQAYQQSFYATVAEFEGKIIGYQISTGAVFSAHLARLAVAHEQQRHHAGYTLVYDLIHHCRQAGVSRVTVNTQHDNQPSLSLYKKIGFIPTGDSFPVFLYE